MKPFLARVWPALREDNSATALAVWGDYCKERGDAFLGDTLAWCARNDKWPDYSPGYSFGKGVYSWKWYNSESEQSPPRATLETTLFERIRNQDGRPCGVLQFRPFVHYKEYADLCFCIYKLAGALRKDF